MTTLKIGQLAKAANVNIDTVRYYERRGLIPEPPRKESGYREYTQNYIARIRFVKRAQDLGFSLNEISELMDLRVDSQTVCSDVKKRTEAKVIDIEEKIQSLVRMKQTLTNLLEHCKSQEPTGECPILAMLDAEEDEEMALLSSQDRKYGQTEKVITKSSLTCPECGFVQRLEMPTSSCYIFHQCSNCKATLKPKPGDCCVFCSYGDIPCPPIQLSAKEELVHKE